ncbi:MAG: type IV pilus twitching motility protein PilT [Gemmatimonadota bacterium]
MSQVQQLLDVLTGQEGAEIRIAEGEMVTLVSAQGSKPLTRQPLTAESWKAIVGQIYPAVALASTNGSQPVEWGSGARKYRVEVSSGQTPPVALVTLVGDALPRSSARALDVMERLLRKQVDGGASDLHLRSNARPQLRSSGDIGAIDDEDPISATELASMLESIMPERNCREFAESGDTDFAYELAGYGRFRVNAFRDRFGPGMVARSIPSRIVTADELGISAEVRALCQLPKGLVLVTGPTGSGKSTTLCALMDLINQTRRDHVITIEDPIEFVHESKGCLVTQRQVGVHTGSFRHALRAALREDPDVVLVGELRDLETMAIAIETAETGHLVLGTLHTSTAASTVDRIIDQFPPDRQEQVRVMLSESLRGVISQTLCRKVGGGRVAAMEVLLVTPAVSNLIREGKTFQMMSIMQTSRKLGMMTMNDALVGLVDKGLAEPREAWLKASDKTGCIAALKAKGHDVSFAEEAAAPPVNGELKTSPARAASALRTSGPGTSGQGARK